MAEALAYRVLRYVEGGLLRDHLFGFFDPHKAARLISGIVAGLEKIHAQGYFHANLKPVPNLPEQPTRALINISPKDTG